MDISKKNMPPTLQERALRCLDEKAREASSLLQGIDVSEGPGVFPVELFGAAMKRLASKLAPTGG